MSTRGAGHPRPPGPLPTSDSSWGWPGSCPAAFVRSLQERAKSVKQRVPGVVSGCAGDLAPGVQEAGGPSGAREAGPQVCRRRGPRSAGGAGSRRKWLPGASLGPKGPAELRGGLAGLGRRVSEGQEVRGRATSRPWTWGVRPHSLRRASEQSMCPPRLPRLL